MEINAVLRATAALLPGFCLGASAAALQARRSRYLIRYYERIVAMCLVKGFNPEIRLALESVNSLYPVADKELREIVCGRKRQ
jgi:hypothetical protein